MDILQTIVEEKRREVARLRPIEPAEWLHASNLTSPRRPFHAALQHPRRGNVALIAEVKKASPSAGIICPNFDPVRIAREYEAGGATCLSVLTDAKFFQGALEYLRAIRASVTLPLLRKDFIIDERQIIESLEWGADAVLLIVSILSQAQLTRYLELAQRGNLDALVEVHDEDELDRAVAAGAQLIGINNRDLKTFKVDLATTERLAARLHQVPRSVQPLVVAESGIRGREDVARLRACGARAILVGETLMRVGDVGATIEDLLR